MADYSEYIELLRSRLTEKRFQHSLNVAKKAQELAEKFNTDSEQAYLAGLLHDICKNETEEKQLKIFNEFGIILDSIQKTQKKLWHQISGAAYVEHILKLGDKAIISAIRCHTTGKENMTKLDMILYLADYISEERDFEGVEQLRECVNTSLEYAVFMALKKTVCDLCERELLIHPETLAAYNQMTVYSTKKRQG